MALPGVEADVVVVAAGRDHAHAEAGRGAHIVEAEQLVVEAARFHQVSYVEVEMSEARLGGDGLVEAVAPAQVGEEGVGVQRLAAIAGAPIGAAGGEIAEGIRHEDAVLGRLAVQLNGVAFRVVQVGGLGHDMVGGGVGPALGKQAGDGDGKLAAVGEEDGKVVQPGDTRVTPPAFDLGQPQQVTPVARPGPAWVAACPVHLQAEQVSGRTGAGSPGWRL